MTIGRHAVGEPHVAANDGTAADSNPPQYRRAGVNHDVVLDDRMARGALDQRTACVGRKAARTQRDCLIDADPLANDGGFADHDAGAVIDEQALSDLGAGMNVDPSLGAGDIGDQARHQRRTMP